MAKDTSKLTIEGKIEKINALKKELELKLKRSGLTYKVSSTRVKNTSSKEKYTPKED